jgi:hypothetical protein
MRVVNDQQGRELVEVAMEAGADLVCESSLKAALDRDWDQHMEKDEALTVVLNLLLAVETWCRLSNKKMHSWLSRLSRLLNR